MKAGEDSGKADIRLEAVQRRTASLARPPAAELEPLPVTEEAPPFDEKQPLANEEAAVDV